MIPEDDLNGPNGIADGVIGGIKIVIVIADLIPSGVIAVIQPFIQVQHVG
jgi:hypothetical protein